MTVAPQAPVSRVLGQGLIDQDTGLVPVTLPEMEHRLTQQACTRIPRQQAWQELVGFATRKVNLEQNDFNLRLSISWLRLHVIVAVLTFSLLAFHVLSVLYFGGT